MYKNHVFRLGFSLLGVGSFTLFIQFVLYLLQSNIAETTSWGGYLYYLMAAFSHAGLFALIPFLLCYLPLSCFLPFPRFNQGLLIAIYFLLNLLAYINGLVFQLYKFHINGLVLDLLFTDNAGQIFVFNRALIFKAATILLFLSLLFSGIVYLAYRFSSNIKKWQITTYFLLFFLCLLGAHLLHAYSAASNHPSIQNVATCLPQFYPLTANKLMLKLGVIRQEELYTDPEEQSFNSGVTYPLHPLTSSDSIPGKNIILIVLDSWNPSVFTPETMPHLTQFSRQANQFTHHLSSSNGTRGSIFGMFFGVSPTYWKEFEIAGIQPLFIKELIKKNYEIKTFPSATLMNPPFYRVIFGDVRGIRTETPGKTPFERDNQLTKDFITYLQEEKEGPFFAFLFYDLLHAIDIPEPYRRKFQPSWDYANYMALNNNLDPEPFFNLYRNCAWHVDSLVHQVLHQLQMNGLLQNSTVILTGDHSQEFNENKKNYWGHGSNYSNAQIHIPMIYYDPQLAPHSFHYMTTHYDIVPTLLSTNLGVQNPPADYSMGQILWDSIRPPYHLTGTEENYAIITSGYIYEKKHTGRIVVTDTLLNPVKHKMNPKILLETIEYKNRFRKKD